MTTPAAAPATTPGAPGAAPGSAPAATDWTAGLDPDSRGFVQTKGWTNPADVLTSYRGLEKLMGAPADKLLRLPTDDKPESWAPIFDKLGRPVKPEEYKFAPFAGAPDEAAAKKFDAFLRNNFHALGITAKQAEGFTKNWSEYVNGTLTEQEQVAEQEATAQESLLRGEWGTTYDQRIAQARQAALGFGLSVDHIDRLEDALGYGPTMKFLAAIGERMGEAEYVDGNTPPGFDGYSQESAMAEINQLKNDAEFGKKIVAGDAEAKAKWQRLHQIAFPDERVVL